MSRSTRQRPFLLLSALLVAAAVHPVAGQQATSAKTETAPAASGGEAIVRIAVDRHGYRAPDEWPAGEVVLRMSNEGETVHMALIERLPDGVPYEKVIRRAAGGTDWYEMVTGAGGLGLLSPGHTAEVTLTLEPGRYVLYCWVKAPDGTPHSAKGEDHLFTVSGPEVRAEVPEPDVELRLTRSGLDSQGKLRAGEQTVRLIHPEWVTGLHLARLEGGVGPDSVAAWLDAGEIAPSPVPFVGGFEPLPGGQTSTLTVDLEPGTYVWTWHASEDSEELGYEVVTVTQRSAARPQKHAALRDTLLRLDSLLFAATFHDCDPERAKELLAEDVEFYHDRGGLLDESRDSWLADMREKGCPTSQRELIEESMEVDRIGDYGALQVAHHEFYVRQGDGTRKLEEVAKFIHLWKRDEAGRWRLARVISYDHRSVE